MVTVRPYSQTKSPEPCSTRRSGPFASPRIGLESVTRSYYYGELEAGAEEAAEALAAASEAAEEAAEAESAAEEAAAAAESAAAGAVVSVLAQPASASAARRALRASFVFIELYPEIEKGKR
jgi:hypothetical protein